MDKKKMIRTAIVAYLIVGITGFGISVYANAAGYDGGLLQALINQNQTVEEEEITEEITEEPSEADEDAEDEYTNSADELEALLEEAHSEDEASTEDKISDEGTVEADATKEENPEATAEEETATTDDTAVLREGPYYSYTITSDFDLNFYDDPDTPTGNEGVLGVIPSGTTGYAIDKGNRRTLIEYEGRFGYVSNAYVRLTEVDASEYPQELKNITWENVVIEE